MRFYRQIGLFCIVIATLSCTSERRAQRKIAKACRIYPPICETDTLRDTTYIVREFEKHDSFYLTLPNDTIEIVNDKVYTRIIRQFDTLRVEQQVHPDTIIQYREKIVQKVKPCNWWQRNLKWIGIAFAGLFFLIVIRMSM